MKTIKEDGEAMGTSSMPVNNISSGNVKTFDPLLGGGIVKRKILQSIDRKKRSNGNHTSRNKQRNHRIKN